MARASYARIRRAQEAVLRWFRVHQRDLPWRRTTDPYQLLVSEVMLQQTQVGRVLPKYREFLRRFPTVQALARATPRDVLLAWAGLGYNRRALYLRRLARDVVTRFGGQVPTDPVSLRTLPGVGAYTAAAVATFSTGVPHVLADTNVQRVIARVFLGKDPRVVAKKRLLRLVERAMPRRAVVGIHPALWGHALMDFGALVCKAKPRCEACPLRRMCKVYPTFQRAKRKGEDPVARPRVIGPGPSDTRTGKVMHGRGNRRLPLPVPDRITRGRILQGVRDADPHPVRVSSFRALISPHASVQLRKLIRGLVREGLLEFVSRHSVRLPVA